MMETKTRQTNNGRYADTRILVEELNQLIADIQDIAPEISIAELQRNSNLPSNELYNIRSGNVNNIHRIREAIRFLKNTKSFISKADKNEESEVYGGFDEVDMCVMQLNELINDYGWKSRHLSTAAGVSRSAIANWVTKRRKPSEEYIKKINDIYDNRHKQTYKDYETGRHADNPYNKKVQEIKSETGWTNKEIGKKTGIGEAGVGLWLQGATAPSKEAQEKIEKLYKKVFFENQSAEEKSEVTETEVTETKAPEKKYSLIERIKFLFTGKL